MAIPTDFDQASGLLSAREGGVGGGTGLINAQVAWDLNGNLTQRQDLKLSPTVTETFVTDSLNRFDSSTRNGTTNADVTLDAIGNILWKKDVCPSSANCYTYHATKKRAVITAGSFSFGYDANGNMSSRNGSTLGYTSYNLPSSIAAGSNSSTLSYGAFRNRTKQVAVASGVTETTIYVAGLLEKMTKGGVTEYRHLIAGGSGTAAIYTRRSDATTTTYYVHADHLGSPELITNSSGVAVVRPSFGAYGERRDGTDWNGAPSAADLTTIGNVSRRGFTGHEHLDAVGLIHMNGRVYEPVAARFLGVDPIVQLGSSQSPNSYAYVWNKPLTMTDPSGFCGGFRERPCRRLDAPGEPALDPGTHNEHGGDRPGGDRPDNGTGVNIRSQASMQDVTLKAIRGVAHPGSTVGGTLGVPDWATTSGICVGSCHGTSPEGLLRPMTTAERLVLDGIGIVVTAPLGGAFIGVVKAGRVAAGANRVFWVGADGQAAAIASGGKLLKPSKAALEAAARGDFTLMRAESAVWARSATGEVEAFFGNGKGRTFLYDELPELLKRLE